MESAREGRGTSTGRGFQSRGATPEKAWPLVDNFWDTLGVDNCKDWEVREGWEDDLRGEML